MGKKYLIDTNILIYYFGDQIPSGSLKEIETIFNNSFNMSFITKIEFLGWKKHTEEGYSLSEKFLEPANVVLMTDPILRLTIDLKRKYLIKLGDAVIASTAIINKMTLVTRNENDFKNIPGLNIFNPFKAE